MDNPKVLRGIVKPFFVFPDLIACFALTVFFFCANSFRSGIILTTLTLLSRSPFSDTLFRQLIVGIALDPLEVVDESDGLPEKDIYPCRRFIHTCNS